MILFSTATTKRLERDFCLQATARTVYVLLLAISVGGCSGSREPSGSDTPADSQQPQATAAEKCRTKLAAAIRRFEPESFALQSSPERTVNSLNSWIKSCGADGIRDLQLDDAAMQLLDANAQRYVTAGIYTAGDATYIRDCWVFRELTRAIVERSTGSGVSDGDQTESQVVAIFDWIVRNISLLGADEERVPLGLCEVVLTGRGTLEDRTWAFAEALRQHQIDAVVVTTDSAPAAGGPLESAAWIVAVVLEDRGLLFDVSTGLPIVAGETTDLQSLKPTDLQTLRDHPRWQNSSVRLVAQTATFAPRMLLLQQRLAAADAAILYEELTGGVSEIRPLVERVLAASGDLWSRERISIWDYPEQRATAALSRSEAEQQQYDRLMRPFRAPFERTAYAPESTEEMTTVPEALPPEERRRLVQERLMNNFARMMESSEEMFGKPSMRLLKGRLQQIMGSIDTGVIQQLQQIRIASMQDALSVRVPEEVQREYGFPPVVAFPFPELIREVNQSSTEDAMYWSAMCQFDRGEAGVAIKTLENYRRQYSTGRWTYSSLINQALALLKQDRNNDARAILQTADVEANPERARVQALLQAIPAS